MNTQQRIYAALVLLALGAGGIYLTSQDKQKQVKAHSVTAASADLPSIGVPKDDGDKITKIELVTPDKDDKAKKNKVTLEKKGEEWMLTAPVTAKANASNVKSLVDNLKDLKVKEQIERTGSSYDAYDLSDDKAVHVVAYKGDAKAVDLFFGKSGSRGQMARVGGKEGVFTTGGYSSYLYNREVKNWRETSILKFEDANAIQVEVLNKNGLFSFSKNGEKWSASLTKRDKEGKLDKAEKEWKKFDEGKVKDLLRAFKALSAEDFGEAKDKADSGVDSAEKDGGIVKIKLKDGAGDLVMKIGKVQKGTSRWAWKDGGDTLFAVSSWTADWATAEASKFEKSDDKKKDDKKDAPPGMPMGMPGMPPGMEMPHED
jgi:hypothetical protein